MEAWHVAFALLSALLHAGWNAAVKSGDDPQAVMTAQMIIGAVIVCPLLVWTGLPAFASWGYMVASTTINIVTVTALLRAYDLAGFGMAYPLARALSVMMVVPVAALVSGESVSSAGLAGVGLIAVALATLATGPSGSVSPVALFWIAVSGFGTAAYVIMDAKGVRASGSPLAYGFLVSITNAVAMHVWRQGFVSPWPVVSRLAARATPIAIASMVSYLLILWVYASAPIAPAAALRDTSAIFAVAIAIIWLREPFTARRLFAMLLAAAAVPLLRYA